MDVFLYFKTLSFHSLAFKGVRIEENEKWSLLPEQHHISFTKTKIKTIWPFWKMVWLIQQIGQAISQNDWIIFAIWKFDIFYQKNFSSSIFVTLIFPIYSFHYFFIPLYYDSNYFIIYLFIIIFLFYLSWGLHPWSRDHVTHTQIIQLLENQEIKFENVT